MKKLIAILLASLSLIGGAQASSGGIEWDKFPKEKMMFHALNVGFTYESILVAADAFKRARSNDPKVLADAIRQTNITSRMMLGGPIRFNPKGQVEGIASACIQNLNQRPNVVLPANAAEAKPVFPVPGYVAA